MGGVNGPDMKPCACVGCESQWEIIQTANTRVVEMPFVPHNRGHFMGRALIPLLVCG